jgi:hypothetical protein
MVKFKEPFPFFTSIIISSVIILTFISLLLYDNYSLKELKKCHILSTGHIEGISDGKTSSMRYYYYLNGKRYTGGYKLRIYDFIGKDFPIVVHCKDSSFSRMLIAPDDFKEYGLPFPDNLNWVIPIIEGK